MKDIDARSIGLRKNNGIFLNADIRGLHTDSRGYISVGNPRVSALDSRKSALNKSSFTFTFLNKYTKPGFTITELFIAVIIVAIFTALSIPVFIKNIEKSKTGEVIGTLNIIRMAEKDYFNENNTFTVNMSDLNIDPPNDIENRYFDYTIVSASGTGGAAVFSAKATRRNGPYQGDYYTIDQNGTIDSTNGRIKL